MRKLLLTLSLMVGMCAAAALANYSATQGSGTTFVAFDATHSGTSLCAAASTQCVAFVTINSAGAEVLVATAANQATANSTLASILTAVGNPIPTQVPTVDIGAVGISQTTPGTTNKVSVAYGTTALIADPCQANTPTIKPISITTATTTNIVTGTSAKKLYVCYLFLKTTAANNVAVISGTTGATCGANTAALVGGTTAANGLNDAANDGQAFGNGVSSVMQVLTNNDDICIITSASTPLAGVIKYVVQ